MKRDAASRQSFTRMDDYRRQGSIFGSETWSATPLPLFLSILVQRLCHSL